MAYYVYSLASRPYGTLYVGVTNDLPRRVYEHREGLVDGFTKSHGVKTLVYFDMLDSIEPAIRREKSLKRWSRPWKTSLTARDRKSVVMGMSWSISVVSRRPRLFNKNNIKII